MTLPKDTMLLQRYRLETVLAQAETGAVYRAFDTNLSIPVVIKEKFLPAPQRLGQLQQQAQILAGLRHPALPRVIDHFIIETRHYLVMDFIEGQDLWEITQHGEKPLPEAEALAYMIQICEAVIYLHQHRPPIIHGEISPRHIKITAAGQAVLVGFGLARQDSAADPSAWLEDWEPVSSFSADKAADVARDVFALGATLYAVLTGQEPPQREALLAGRFVFEAPQLINPDLSQDTAQAIVYALQPQAHQRPPSVRVWQQRLEAAAAILNSVRAGETFALDHHPKQPHWQTEANAAAALNDEPRADFWLIDHQGNSYPVGTRPLKIGCHANADVVIAAANVSPEHAEIKLEGNRCFVLDHDSASGTFLNGDQIRLGWYPLSQGDILTIGPARFYLAVTPPPDMSAARHDRRSASPDESPLPGPPTPVALRQADPDRGVANWNSSLAVIVITIFAALLTGLGIGGYLWLQAAPAAPITEDGRQLPSQGMATQTMEPPTPVVTATDGRAAGIVAASPPPTRTAPVTPPTATLASGGSGVSLPTPPVLPSPTQTTLPSPTATELSLPTATPLPSPTATPALLLAATPTPPPLLGPTVMPLNSQVSVPELGQREVIGVANNPKNPIEVFALVKGDGIYKSILGGDGPWARVDLDGSAITGIVVDPTNPARLYASTWNAVLKSSDGGNSWEAKTQGLVSNQVVEVVTIHPLNPDILYAGVGETLVVSEDQGHTWTSQGYGTGLGVTRLYDIAVDPFQPDIVYVAGLAGSIYKSVDSGRTFEQLPYNVGQGAYSLAARPDRPNEYLVGINSPAAGIIKTDNGIDFRPVSSGLIFGGADSAYSAIIFAPSNSQVVYTGSGYESNRDAKGIFKSIDGGETWTAANRGLAVNPDTGYPYYVRAIAIHPTNSSIIFAATGSGLYKSISGGESWELK